MGGLSIGNGLVGDLGGGGGGKPSQGGNFVNQASPVIPLIEGFNLFDITLYNFTASYDGASAYQPSFRVSPNLDGSSPDTSNNYSFSFMAPDGNNAGGGQNNAIFTVFDNTVGILPLVARFTLWRGTDVLGCGWTGTMECWIQTHAGSTNFAGSFDNATALIVPKSVVIVDLSGFNATFSGSYLVEARA